jgi:TonB family protein
MGLWRYGAVWILVLVVHLAFGWLITRASSPQAPLRAPIGPLTMITLATSVSKAAIAPSFSVTLLPIGLTVPDLPAPGSVESEDDGAVMTQSNGLTIPPHPDETFTLNAATFARQAGLQGGLGVTVVVRVEVHGSGAVGRVEVDVSGGNRRIDQAAIAYVRGLKWVGGRVRGEPQTLWIRWGVRLQGLPEEAAVMPQA